MMQTFSMDAVRKLRIFSQVEPGLCIAEPCMSLTMYSSVRLADLGPLVAEVINRYLSFVPATAIASAYVPGGDDNDDDYVEGYFETFDEEVRDAVFGELTGDVCRTGSVYGLLLSGGEHGEGASYGIRFMGSQMDQSDFPEKSNLLRLDVPVCETEDALNQWVAFVSEILQIYPAFSGICGLSFGYTYSFEPEVRQAVNALVPRYRGVDISYDWMQRRMRDRVPPINWLTFMAQHLLDKLGGLGMLGEQLTGVTMTRLTSGLLIRGSARPPLGDINRLASDIGCLPSVSRALKAVRFDSVDDVGMSDTAAARRWLDRLDDMDDRSWENR